MNIFVILLHTHSVLRWLIVIAAIAALALFGYSWLGKKSFPKLARIFSAAYSGLLDMQVLLGLIYLLLLAFNGGGFPLYRIEHMTVLFFAALVAHLPSRWKKAEKALYHRNTFLAILGSLVLIFIGVAMLPDGWNR